MDTSTIRYMTERWCLQSATALKVGFVGPTLQKKKPRFSLVGDGAFSLIVFSQGVRPSRSFLPHTKSWRYTRTGRIERSPASVIPAKLFKWTKRDRECTQSKSVLSVRVKARTSSPGNERVVDLAMTTCVQVHKLMGRKALSIRQDRMSSSRLQTRSYLTTKMW